MEPKRVGGRIKVDCRVVQPRNPGDLESKAIVEHEWHAPAFRRKGTKTQGTAHSGSLQARFLGEAEPEVVHHSAMLAETGSFAS